MKNSLPKWVLPLAISLGVLIVVFVSYKAFTGSNGDNKPPIEVHPGMYDFRKEAAAGNLGRKNRTQPPGN